MKQYRVREFDGTFTIEVRDNVEDKRRESKLNLFGVLRRSKRKDFERWETVLLFTGRFTFHRAEYKTLEEANVKISELIEKDKEPEQKPIYHYHEQSPSNK